MDNISEDYFSSKPQRLCHMCGKCCRCVTTATPYEELKKEAEAGEEGAVDFLKLFEPYPTIESVREIAPETVDNIIDALKSVDRYDETKLTFYGCRFLNDDNTCSIYENRMDLCKRFPSSPWSVVPPNCGFEGWLFQQREYRKAQVRKQKENILSLQTMIKSTQSTEQLKEIIETIDKLKNTIKKYEKYGSADW